MKSLGKYYILLFYSVLSIPAFADSSPFIINSIESAEKIFSLGKDGCPHVWMAIKVAKNPQLYGPTSKRVRDELIPYAERCNFLYQLDSDSQTINEEKEYYNYLERKR